MNSYLYIIQMLLKKSLLYQLYQYNIYDVQNVRMLEDLSESERVVDTTTTFKSLIHAPAHQLKIFKNLQSFCQFLHIPQEETEVQRERTYPDKTTAKQGEVIRSPDVSIHVFIPLCNSGSLFSQLENWNNSSSVNHTSFIRMQR